MHTALLATTLASLAALSSATQTGKPINPPYNWVEGTQIKDLTNDLKSHEYSPVKWEDWAAGMMPLACFTEAKSQKLVPADFQVRNVHFTDCSASWAMCRHKNSPYTWATIMTTMSKVPVGMRQYVANAMFLPPGDYDFGAYTTGYVTVFNEFDIGIAAHEFSHILDPYEKGLVAAMNTAGYPAGTWWSSTTFWVGGVGKDTQMPTEYASKTYLGGGGLAEDFADSGRWALSEMVHEGRLATYSSGWAHSANQIGAYRGRLQDVLFPSDGKCTAKRDTTQAVSSATGKKARGLAMRRSSNIAGTGVEPIDTPAGVSDSIKFAPYPLRNRTASA